MSLHIGDKVKYIGPAVSRGDEFGYVNQTGEVLSVMHGGVIVVKLDQPSFHIIGGQKYDLMQIQVREEHLTKDIAPVVEEAKAEEVVEEVAKEAVESSPEKSGKKKKAKKE